MVTNETLNSLNKEIEDLSYFRSARLWHVAKYLYTYTQFIYLLTVVCIAAAAVVAVARISMQKYTVTAYPFVVYADDQVNYFTKIEPLSQSNESINLSIARYLSKQYVKRREEYRYTDRLNPEAWRETLTFIKNTSSRQVFTEFINYVDTKQNPESPILKYKLQANRFIAIQSIEFIGDKRNPNGAKISFKAIEKYPDYENSSLWCVELRFSARDIAKALDSKTPLRFLITKYTSTELKD